MADDPLPVLRLAARAMVPAVPPRVAASAEGWQVMAYPYRIPRRYRRYGRSDSRGPAIAVALLVALLAASGTKAVTHHGAAPAQAARRGCCRDAGNRLRPAATRQAVLLGRHGDGLFDCSGLVMEAYAAAGVTIPRTSEVQWADLPHVPTLQPGDLIFYAGADGTVASPGHVVLYIGGGQVIQAYATGYPVMVSSLASMNAGGLTGYARPS